MEGFLYKNTWEIRNFDGYRDEQESFSVCVDRRLHVKYRKKDPGSSTPRISVVEIKACDSTCQSKTALPPEVEEAVTEWLKPANRQ
jgi:hypothetical protein